MNVSELRVLVVDDDAGDAEMVGEYLAFETRWDLVLTHCPDAASCRRALKDGPPPDVILLDYHLGKDSGLDLLWELTDHYRDTTAIIVLTGCGNEAVAVEAMKRGAADYIPKDHITRASLLRVVTSALERRALYRELDAERRARLEARLEAERDRAMAETLASACHHLAQPLTALAGALQLLVQGALDDDGRTRLVEDCLHEARRLAALVHRLRRVKAFRETMVGSVTLLDIGVSPYGDESA